jgi:hypothetical protein
MNEFQYNANFHFSISHENRLLYTITLTLNSGLLYICFMCAYANNNDS